MSQLLYVRPLCDGDFLSECIFINWMWSTILGVPEPVFTLKKIVLNHEKAFSLLWAKAVVLSS